MSDKVWFCKQRITNACGTVGLLHALINAEDHVGMDGWLKKFAANCRDKDPETRASILEGDSEVSSGRCGCLLRSQMELRGACLVFYAQACNAAAQLDACQADAAEQGQTRPPALDEVVKLHFVTMVQRDGCLYELDGRKPFPLNLGPSQPGQLLQDAVAVIKSKYMAADPAEVNFNILALAPNVV